MKSPGLPRNETQRLAELRDLDILDTDPEQPFDDLANLAALILDTPIALVSLVDENRQWFKARVGLNAPETGRDVSFCGHAVEAGSTLIVPNADEDERFFDNPLTTDDPRVVFYAGAPLVTQSGVTLGTLCAIDNKPRQVSPEQVSALEALARQVVSQIELRSLVRESRQAAREERASRLAQQELARLLKRLQHAMKSSKPLHRKLRKLLEMGCESLAAEFGLIAEWQDGKLSVLQTSGSHPALRRHSTFPDHTGPMLMKSAASSGVVMLPGQLMELRRVCLARVQADNRTGLVLFGNVAESSSGDIVIPLIEVIRDSIEIEVDRERVHRAMEAQALEALVRKKLAMSEQARFFDVANDMLVVGNFEGFYTELNPAAERILGFTIDELKSHHFTHFVHPDDVEASVAAALEAGRLGVRRDFENRYRHKDGGYRWLRWSMTADAQSRTVYATARDVTERRRIEQMKSEFVSTVSHELRTPLTSIRGSLGLLLGGAAGDLPTEAKTLLDMACNNTDRLVRLINDMLDLEKIESGEMRLHRESVDLVALIESAMAANATFAESHGTFYTLAQAPEAARVHADPDRITQVTDNLLSNAAKYAANSGEVAVSIVDDGGQWLVQVQDRGPGVSESFRKHLFERFSQADSGSTRQSGGTGLGLSIAQAIVQQHQGTLGHEAPPEGGSLFWFSLPAVALQPTPLSRDPDQSPDVLIVEDDQDIARLIEMMLGQRRIRATIATTAAQAAELIQSRKFSAITLDLGLPDESGMSLLARMQEQLGSAMPPVVVVSANSDGSDDGLRGDALGIVGWIRKPINEQRLVEAIQNAAARDLGQLRILHVEDDPSIIEITRRQVAPLGELIAAQSIGEAREKLASERFDLVIVDLGLPDGNGQEIIEEIKSSHRALPVIIYSAEEIQSSLRGLVSAALVKTRHSQEDLLEVIGDLVDRVAQDSASRVDP